MIKAISIFTMALSLGLAMPNASWAQANPSPPPPAETLGAKTHLILTVPLNDRETLEATAARIEARYNVTLATEWPLQSIAVHCYVVRVDENTDIADLATRMRADADIQTVQQMQDFRTFESHDYGSLVSAQNALIQLNAIAAQHYSKGSGVQIGVVDSGIDVAHPDLANQLASLHDFVSDDKQPAAEAHGTAIAGIIAADDANDEGMLGVAPKANLIGLRACWQATGQPGQCNSFSLARALNFSILKNISPINMSLGGNPDPLLETLVRAAIARGIIIIAASGDGAENSFPASVPGVIAAGQAKGDIPAPAVDVISAAPDDQYGYFSGSSVAAAHVSGVVALMLAANPDLNNTEIKKALDAAVTIKDETPMLDACVALNSVTEESLDCAQ